MMGYLGLGSWPKGGSGGGEFSDVKEMSLDYLTMGPGTVGRQVGFGQPSVDYRN